MNIEIPTFGSGENQPATTTNLSIPYVMIGAFCTVFLLGLGLVIGGGFVFLSKRR